MCLNKLKNILSVDECTLFETRYREGYDLHDDSSQGKLWQTYKAIRILLSTDATDAPPLFLANIVEVPQLLATNIAEIPPSSPTNTDKMPQSPPANYEEMPPSSPANIENGIFLSLPSVPSSIQSEVTLVVDSNMLQPLASTSSGTKPSLLLQSDIDIVSPSTPIMSPSPPSEQIADDLFEFPDLGIPSTSRQQSYDNFQFSPFKHYLKISENTIITRKPVKTKPKTPSAISGKEFRDNLKEQQEKKENELKEKERRKKEREEKKLIKSSTKKTNKRKIIQTVEVRDDEIIEETSSEEEILFAASSDDDIDGLNVCAACGGDEDWGKGNKWIGCNKCSGWVHKACISLEIEAMTNAELKKFYFICSKCQKRHR